MELLVSHLEKYHGIVIRDNGNGLISFSDEIEYGEFLSRFVRSNESEAVVRFRDPTVPEIIRIYFFPDIMDGDLDVMVHERFQVGENFCKTWIEAKSVYESSKAQAQADRVL